MIDIKIDCSGVMQTLARLEQAVTHRAPVMRAIAEVMHEAVLENFIQEGRPKWQGLKPPGRPGGKILQVKGHLLNSITPASDNDNAVVGTDLKYAAIHQFGGKTRAHEIRPRNKKALAFGGRVVKKVNHPGSNIPARPFLLLTDQDVDEIEGTMNDYLREVVGG